MKNIFTNLRLPALISFLLVSPFMILELVNRWNFHEGFPVPVFAVMWLLPVAFILILMPVVRKMQERESLLARPFELLLRVAFLALIAFVWVGTLIDQMPCFLGVPLCD